MLFQGVGNRFNWKQKRSLLITNKYLYNFKGTKLKRKISLLNIAATTVSEDPSSDEFVIHVPDEYDYRYTSGRYFLFIIVGLPL